MARDYNKLMEDLDKCLGLEKSATESFESEGDKKAAFDKFDEVESELAGELGLGENPKFEEEDFTFEEEPIENDNPEDKKEVFKGYVSNLFDSLLEEGLKEEEARETIKSLVKEVLPDEDEDEEGKEGEAEEGIKSSAESYDEADPDTKAVISQVLSKLNAGKCDEAKELLMKKFYKIGPEFVKPKEGAETSSVENIETKNTLPEILSHFKKGIGRKTKFNSEKEMIESAAEFFEDFEDGSGLGSNPTLEEVIEYSKDYCEEYEDEISNPIEFGKAMYLIDKADLNLYDILKTMENGETATENIDPEGSPKEREEQTKENEELAPAVEEVKEEKKEKSAEESFSEAFEEKKAKMLSRYQELAEKSPSMKKVALEGMGEVEVPIDEQAISRVSGEHGYSGKYLREIVAKALKEGII